MIINIYFIRHGDPNYVLDSLTDLGKRQADKTGEYLSNIPFDVVYASSLGRAMETASYTAKRLKLPIIKLDWAREDKAWEEISMYYESRKGNSWIFKEGPYLQRMKELQDDPLWYKDSLFSPCVEQGIKRVNKALDEWLLSLNIVHDREKHTFKAIGDVKKNIALFAHGGFGSLFVSAITDMNYAYYANHYHEHDCCGITHFRIRLDDKTPIEIVDYNSIEHLKDIE